MFSRRNSVRSRSESRVSAWPATQTTPLLGVSIPLTRFSSVLLPEPLLPTRTTNSPKAKVALTSCSTTRVRPPSSKLLLTRSRRTSGSAYRPFVGRVVIIDHPGTEADADLNYTPDCAFLHIADTLFPSRPRASILSRRPAVRVGGVGRAVSICPPLRFLL